MESAHMSETIVYRARSIRTLDPNRPLATHVAVRDGRILAVGSLEDLRSWGPHTLDERFANQVLLPGFVEGHSHMMAGSIWHYTFCGPYDTRNPEGRLVSGLRSIDSVVARLRQRALSEPEAKSITGWGLDPILIGAQRMTRHELDAVSPDRPVGVLHASGHVLYANSAAMRQAGMLRAGVDHPGIPLGDDGLPTGEFRGPETMMSLTPIFGLDRTFLGSSEFGVHAFGQLAIRVGVTTATDLGASCDDAQLSILRRMTDDEAYPLRLVLALRAHGLRPADVIARAVALKAQSSERLRLGLVKIVADGSIQGFSARLRWPGYHNGAPNGLWYVAPETVRQTFDLALQQGIQVHVHTNGDEATEMVIDAMEQALSQHPRPDHRFTLQHCQMADAAQMQRMHALGMCANLFANHIYYWGEAHLQTTIGFDRATRMNACRTALDTGLTFAIHSDAPITPLDPLFSIWCATHRQTNTGRSLGEHQRIGVADALHAVTLGAARTLKLDHEIGSIACGKRADFCVLEADPIEVPPQEIKDIRVWGTVQGGRPFQAN